MIAANADTAARLYRSRRVRDEVFGEARDGFGEPAWDMLLALFARDQDDGLRTEDVIAATPAPASIAQTYLDWMASRDLVICGERVALTDRGRDLMAAYLDREENIRGA